MLQELSPTKELVDLVELAHIVEHSAYPKPRWMLNESIRDLIWILARIGTKPTEREISENVTDEMPFKRLVSPSEYLTEQAWTPLLTDLQDSLLFLDNAGKITRPLRIRDVFYSATNLILHTNELRQTEGKQLVRSLDAIKFEDIKSYLMSFSVERSVFESTLQIILGRWSSKKDIDWKLLKKDSGLTTRAFKSLRNKIIKYLNANFEEFKATRSYSREYPQAVPAEFNIDFDLAPNKKSISNEISQLEALYTARPAQQYKFQYSPMELFASGNQIFEEMIDSKKTPLMPINVSLHVLSSALNFLRVYALPLRQYVSDLHAKELARINELNYAPSTTNNHKNSIQDYAFKTTPMPEVLKPLNITTWWSKKDDKAWTECKQGLSVSNAIKLYIAAIWIALASFTTGRATSLLTLRRNCFQQSPVDGLFDLILRIPKRSKRFELEENYRPIPDLIYDYGLEFAALVCELEDRRCFSANDSELFLFGAILGGASTKASRYRKGNFYKKPLGLSTIYGATDFFQDWCASPLINGKRWYPSTHQLRRLFAVLYFNFTNQQGLEELCWFMGHADLKDTFHYAEISPTDEWLEEAEISIARIGSQLNRTISGDKTVQGLIESARKVTDIATVLEPLVYNMIQEHKSKTGQEVRFSKIEEDDVFFYFIDP
jgi:hypothetical protein